MKRILSLAALILAMTACNTRVNPFLTEWDTPYGIPPYEQIQPSDYIPAVKAGIEQQIAEIDAITASTDSIQKERKDAKIIILGDFNDSPDSPLLRQNFKGFTNLAIRYQGKDSGSYKYQGEWETIDQILICNALTHPETKGLRYHDAKVLNLPFLLEADTQYGGEKPKRTFVGYRYNGGFSDHLPVILFLAPSLL